MLQLFVFPVLAKPGLQLFVAGKVVDQILRIEIRTAFDEG